MSNITNYTIQNISNDNELNSINDSVNSIYDLHKNTIDVINNLEKSNDTKFLSQKENDLDFKINSNELFSNVKMLSEKPKINKKDFSYYMEHIEYQGYISEINHAEKSIKATLTNAKNEYDSIIATIDFDDIDENLDLLKLGSYIIWMIGKEYINGSAKHTSSVIVRRTPLWKKNVIETSNKLAENLFDKLNDSI